jgi:glycosyltransferase involved in cell wall biosynthesis
VSVQAPHLPGDPGKVEFEHWTYPRAAAREGFQLAHVPHFGPPLFSQVASVVTVHDLIPLVLPAYRGSLLVRTYTWLASAGARRARILIADSEASRRDIISQLGIPKDRVRVIYLAADSRYRPITDPAELRRVRARYSLPERFILYLGGFDVRKNVRLAVEAFAALLEERTAGWRFVIAGRLPDAESEFFPDPRANAPADVQFIGPPEEADKPALYSAASAFLFPSLYEGFGLPILEAMASEVPVVTSTTSAMPEVAGDAALVVDPCSVDAIADALVRITTDEELRSVLVARGRARLKDFDWDRSAKKFWRLIVDLTGQASPRASRPYTKVLRLFAQSGPTRN